MIEICDVSDRFVIDRTKKKNLYQALLVKHSWISQSAVDNSSRVMTIILDNFANSQILCILSCIKSLSNNMIEIWVTFVTLLLLNELKKCFFFNIVVQHSWLLQSEVKNCFRVISVISDINANSWIFYIFILSKVLIKIHDWNL